MPGGQSCNTELFLSLAPFKSFVMSITDRSSFFFCIRITDCTVKVSAAVTHLVALSSQRKFLLKQFVGIVSRMSFSILRKHTVC